MNATAHPDAATARRLMPYLVEGKDVIVVPTAGVELTTTTTLARATATFAQEYTRAGQRSALLAQLLGHESLPEHLMLAIARHLGAAGTYMLTSNPWLTESAWAQVRAATSGLARWSLYRHRLLTGPQVQLVTRGSVERSVHQLSAIAWQLTSAEIEAVLGTGRPTAAARARLDEELQRRAAGDATTVERPLDGHGGRLLAKFERPTPDRELGDPLDRRVNAYGLQYRFSIRGFDMTPVSDALQQELGDGTSAGSLALWLDLADAAPGFEGSIRDLLRHITGNEPQTARAPRP